MASEDPAKPRKRKRPRKDFGRKGILVAKIEWLHGRSPEDNASACEEFMRSAAAEFDEADAALRSGFNAVWDAIGTFVEARGRAAGSVEKVQEALGEPSPVDHAIRLQLQAAKAVEALEPLHRIVWANMLAIGWNSTHKRNKGPGLSPTGVTNFGHLISSRTYEKALRAYTQSRTGPRKDRAKRALLGDLADAWVSMVGKKLSTSHKRGTFFHFLELALPVANHEIIVTIEIDEEFVGRFGSFETESVPPPTVINFQDECRKLARKKDRNQTRRHYLMGSMERWLKERLGADRSGSTHWADRLGKPVPGI